jgi:NitT/TauT family transport system ATP-binding protein
MHKKRSIKMKIELIDINKSFYHSSEIIEIFKHFNLSISSGEFVAIMGPNGCGKSTLLNLINGLDKKFEGNIKIEQINNSRPAFAYMMQKDLLLPWRTVYENIVIGLEVQGKITSHTRGYVLQHLKRFGISDLISSYPAKLSGGERQKVALVRTLIMQSDILLLDEPFSAIDYNTRIELQGKIYNIAKEKGNTTLLITHDIDEAIAVSDRVVILNYKPLGILKDLKIDLSVENRNPITVRQHSMFADYYSEIWRSLPKQKENAEV